MPPILNTNTVHWNDRAKAFHNASSKQLAYEQRFFKTYFNPPTEAYFTFCDAGCGSGAMVEWVSKLFLNAIFIGFDSSKEMVKIAKQQFSKNKSRVTYRKIDIQRIPYHQCFDVFTSFFVLQWVKNPRTALLNIYHSLKPGGNAYLIIPLRHIELWDGIEAAAAMDKWRDHFVNFVNPRSFYSEAQYKEMFQSAGFNLSTFEREEEIHQMSREQLTKMIRAWLPHLTVLPQKYHDEFLSDIIAQIEKTVPVNSDQLYVTFRTVNIVCMRPSFSLPEEYGVSTRIQSQTRQILYDRAPAYSTRSKLINDHEDFVVPKLRD